MTSQRKPNRRPLRELRRHASGELCPTTLKLRFTSAQAARVAMGQVAIDDPSPEKLGVYRCGYCGDWHFGHDR